MSLDCLPSTYFVIYCLPKGVECTERRVFLMRIEGTCACASRAQPSVQGNHKTAAQQPNCGPRGNLLEKTPGWRPSLLGWRRSKKLLGWRPSLLGHTSYANCRPDSHFPLLTFQRLLRILRSPQLQSFTRTMIKAHSNCSNNMSLST